MTLQIMISRVPVGPKFLEVAKLGSEVVGKGKQPFYDACRNLIEMGHDPRDKVTMQWEGSEVISFSGRLGVFASKAISESENNGPKMVWYRENNLHLKP